MKHLFFFLIIAAITLTTEAQKPEIRLRGGINMFNPKDPGKSVGILPHLGAQAGIRIKSIGIYGELQYTTLEDVNTYETLGYILPSIVGRWYATKLLFVELGPSFLIPAGKIDNQGLLSNPDKTFTFFGGGGIYSGKIEIASRIYLTPRPTMQLTFGLKF